MTESDIEFDLFLEAFEAYQQVKRYLDNCRLSNSLSLASCSLQGIEKTVEARRNELRAAFSRIVAGAVRKELAANILDLPKGS